MKRWERVRPSCGLRSFSTWRPRPPRAMHAPGAAEALVYNTYGICGVCALLEKRHVAPPPRRR